MFKKFIVSLVISATSMSAFAADDVLIRFNDGTHAVYKNVPEDWDNNQFIQYVRKDHTKEFTIVKVETSVSNDSGPSIGQIIGTIVGVVLLVAIVRHTAKSGYAGPCLNPTDRASNGSLCGARAATVRPGGKF